MWFTPLLVERWEQVLAQIGHILCDKLHNNGLMTDWGLAKLARIAQEDAENGESSQDEVVVHVRKNLDRTDFD